MENVLLKMYSEFCKINEQLKVKIKEIILNFSQCKSFHIKQRGLILLYLPCFFNSIKSPDVFKFFLRQFLHEMPLNGKQ